MEISELQEVIDLLREKVKNVKPVDPRDYDCVEHAITTLFIEAVKLKMNCENN